MASSRRGAHILITDDDGDSREMYRQMLEVAGFHVETASSGASALRSARVRQPDLILMDLVMPGMDGGLVLKELRADERTSAVPVLALTGVPEWLDDYTGEARFDSVLTKPVEADRLISEIRIILDRRAAPARPEF